MFSLIPGCIVSSSAETRILFPPIIFDMKDDNNTPCFDEAANAKLDSLARLTIPQHLQKTHVKFDTLTLEAYPYQSFLCRLFDNALKKNEIEVVFPLWQLSNRMMLKMVRNSYKAIKEHSQRDSSGAYAPLYDALPSIKAMEHCDHLSPLSFTYGAAARQGARRFMEDVHFFKEIEQGAIMGVLDGHGSVARHNHEVGKYASERFQQKFSETLSKTCGNVHEAFERLIDAIQQEIIKWKEWDKIGSTAVLSFIDKQTHQIYTATLGDSEANIYRKNEEGQLQSIPLSCVRDWSSDKDARRAAIALEAPIIAMNWPEAENPKTLYFHNNTDQQTNVSRSFGNKNLAGTKEVPGVIHKPKITVNQLQPGDILIFSCDGLKDYVSEKEIVNELVKTLLKDPDKNLVELAKQLVDYALFTKMSQDNVTILTVKVSM